MILAEDGREESFDMLIVEAPTLFDHRLRQAQRSEFAVLWQMTVSGAGVVPFNSNGHADGSANSQVSRPGLAQLRKCGDIRLHIKRHQPCGVVDIQCKEREPIMIMGIM